MQAHQSVGKRAIAGLSGTLATLLIMPTLASAQSPTPKWEVEVHGGYQTARTPVDATSQLPPAGPDFTYVGVTSRHVPSWYFGDGAKLFNASLASLGVAGRISPLDLALTDLALVRPSGGTFGFAIARRLTSRFAADIAIDISNSAPRMSANAMAQVEKTRQSFANAWKDVFPLPLSPLPPLYFLDKTVSSTSEVRIGGDKRETVVTGSLKTAIARGQHFELFATTGAGIRHCAASAPGFTLVELGAFTAVTSNSPPIVLGTFGESDSVTVRYEGKNTHFVGVLGIGVSAHLHKHQGLRLDLRFFLSGDSMDTIVSATPASVEGSPAFDFARGNLVFSNHPTATPSLSGQPLVDFKTRIGSGTVVQRLITVGYFVRF